MTLDTEVMSLRQVPLFREVEPSRLKLLAFTSERVEVVAVTTGPYTLGAAMTRGSDTRTAQQSLARLAVDLVMPRETP